MSKIIFLLELMVKHLLGLRIKLDILIYSLYPKIVFGIQFFGNNCQNNLFPTVQKFTATRPFKTVPFVTGVHILVLHHIH